MNQTDRHELLFFGQVTAHATHELKNHLALINEFNGLIGDLVAAHERGHPLNLERIKTLAQDVKRQVAAGGKALGDLNRFAHSVDEEWCEVDLGERLRLMAALAGRQALGRGATIQALTPEPALAVCTRPFLLLLVLYQGITALLEQAQKGDRLVLSAMDEAGALGVRLALEGRGKRQPQGTGLNQLLPGLLPAEWREEPWGLSLRFTPNTAFPGEAQPNAGAKMTKGKVLLVDDRPEFVKVMAERIASRGYEVGTAGGGQEAIKAVQESKYDAVVLDMVMPEMDGIETLRRLRGIDRNVAVIVLTGYGSSQEVAEALSLGARDYLVKPADLDELLERVEEAIADKASSR